MPTRIRERVALKRAYDTPARSDGYRVLVDRVWPRGVTKEELRLHDWLKNMAPSTELRKWFGHDPAKWLAFKHRYFRELAEHSDAIKTLRAKSRAKTLTLVFAAKDPQHNNAVALKEYLERRAGHGSRSTLE